MSKEVLMTNTERLNMLVEAGDKPYEEYNEIFYDAYQGGSTFFEFHSDKMYYFFVENYDLIPKNYRLRILVDLITNDRAVGEEWFSYLIKSICDMPEKDYLEISKEVRKQYGHLADKDGYITVYKGKNRMMNKLQNIYDFNFTMDKGIAKWFAERCCCGELEENKAKIIAYRVHIDDILYYNNNRNEKEVIICPVYYKNQYEHKVKKVKTEILKNN